MILFLLLLAIPIIIVCITNPTSIPYAIMLGILLNMFNTYFGSLLGAFGVISILCIVCAIRYALGTETKVIIKEVAFSLILLLLGMLLIAGIEMASLIGVQ